MQQRAARLLLGALRAGDIDSQRQVPSSRCEQCHVYSRRIRLNTGLLFVVN